VADDARVLVEDVDRIRTITFNRPEVKNALTVAMRDELCARLDEADLDPGIRAVIITGTDPSFSAGVDFKDVSPTYHPRERRFVNNPGRALRAMRTPVIAAVNGPCVSGGLEIALSATFAIASERARFADTHARLNRIPMWGLTALLPQAVGLRKAREMSATGNFVEADEALRIGLVNHVVPHDELLPFAQRLAGDIADVPAVPEVLSLYEVGQDLGPSAAMAIEMTHAASRAFDRDEFATRGSATAARNREPSEPSEPTEPGTDR
jgi:enoyl-CoA hydratase